LNPFAKIKDDLTVIRKEWPYIGPKIPKNGQKKKKIDKKSEDPKLR
jgi:hypothetical protein